MMILFSELSLLYILKGQGAERHETEIKNVNTYAIEHKLLECHGLSTNWKKRVFFCITLILKKFCDLNNNLKKISMLDLFRQI